MFPIDLSGKKGIVFGVANDRSIAWGITQALSQAGARIALTYQGDRLKERVESLAATLDSALTLPCDATDDDQIAQVFQSLKEEFGDISFLVHSIAFANKDHYAFFHQFEPNAQIGYSILIFDLDRLIPRNP